MRVLKLYMDHYKIPDLHQKMLDQIEKNSQSLYGFFKSLMESDRSYGTILYRALRNFRPCLIMNKARDERGRPTSGASVADVARKYLLIDLHFLGAVPYDARVHSSLTALRAVLRRRTRTRPRPRPSAQTAEELAYSVEFTPTGRRPRSASRRPMIKRIEDWTYYELLNVERTASQDEIREGYQAALATYAPAPSPPTAWSRTESAARSSSGSRRPSRPLRDPAQRRDYDLALLRQAPYFPPKASFRKSVGKLEIEDAPVRKTLWARLKRLFG